MPGIDTYTKLLLHGNGTDGGTAFPDSSYYNRTETISYSPTTVTSNYKFNSSSMYLKGSSTGGYVSYPDSDDFDIGSNDFVYDFWFKPSISLTDGSYNTSYYHLFGAGQLVNTNNTNAILIRIISSATIQLNFYYMNNTITPVYYQFLANIQDWQNRGCNDWAHYAFVRSGGNAYIFINGQSISATNTLGTNSMLSFAASFDVGIAKRYGINAVWGYCNEFRLSIGTDRGWTSDFTPPAMPYDANTDSMIATD